MIKFNVNYIFFMVFIVMGGGVWNNYYNIIDIYFVVNLY